MAEQMKAEEERLQKLEKLRDDRIKIYQKVKNYRDVVLLLKNYRENNQDEIDKIEEQRKDL